MSFVINSEIKINYDKIKKWFKDCNINPTKTIVTNDENILKFKDVDYMPINFYAQREE